MILGVPTMAVIYIYVKKIYEIIGCNAKDLATKTEIYEDFDKYKINKEDIFGEGSCVPYDGTGETKNK